jgi:GntR family transcriptional regulator
MSVVMTIPPWAPVPDEYLYVQLADHLQARIDGGDLPPGSRLPAENDLAAEYRVAYHTVRGAVRLLRDRGRVRTLRGRGTYVAGHGDAPPA